MNYLFDLPCYGEKDGKLTAFESMFIPEFSVNRIFYIYDVPGGMQRADHACMNSRIVLIAISGSVNISMEVDGSVEEYLLDRKNKALMVPAGAWIKAYNFSSDAVLLGLSELNYNDCIYITDYSKYRSVLKER